MKRVTWGEMVEAGLVAKFRDSKSPVIDLRPAVERLRQQFGDYPLARARPLLGVSPSVMMDPQLAFGQPALRAVRTGVLAEDFRAGTDRGSLA